jgi:hypothetical protein
VIRSSERAVSSTVRAWSPTPSSAMVTSEAGVIGVAALIRTHTSKAIFWSARLSSSGFGSAIGSAGPSALASESGSPKRMWMSPLAPDAPHEPHEPAEALALLGGAALLGDVVADVLDLVVGDRDRDQEHVVALAAAVGVDHVGEHPEARRQQLAGARAAALEVPLEREALLDQVVDVLRRTNL